MRNNIVKNNDWVIIDASNKVLGRLASFIASLLTGKNNINYSSYNIYGNPIIVINSKDIKITGNKINNKFYYRHSGYPGGLKKVKMKDYLENDPTFILRNAVKGMLPKNKLQKIFLKRLKIYSDDKHPHIAQNPKEVNFIKGNV